MEVLKFLTGVGTNLKGKLLMIDTEDMTFATVNMERKESCPDCGDLRRGR
jgi:molybdopterin/thiamine biosynthesis adenylyltransferase